jgi:hypothetical protein
MASQLVLDAAGTARVLDSGPVESPRRPAAALLANLLVHRLTTEIVSPTSVTASLRDLADAARTAMGNMRQKAVSTDDSASAVRANASDISPAMLTARIRYDEFFSVRRVACLSKSDFRLGVLSTVTNLCEDACGSILGLPELTAVLHAVELMVGAVECAEPAGHADTSRRVPSAPTTLQQDSAKDNALAQVAMQRWLTGHHVFALCSDFGAHHLARAREAVDRVTEPDAGLVGHLRHAAVFIRACGGAMCYASSFPRSVYLDHVRPQMQRAAASTTGFSGIDNYDYLVMRESWQTLYDAFTNTVPVASWNPDVGWAARELFDAIVEENERHTLLAATLVGSAPSLKGVKDIAMLSATLGATPAVEVLRQATDDRRAMLELFTVGPQRKEQRSNAPR